MANGSDIFGSGGIHGVDWRALWKQQHADKSETYEAGVWNARAKEFSKRELSPYTRLFIDFLELEPGESVLDMGCGSGDIACRLALAGHDVVAADFSSEMLRCLEQQREELGIPKAGQQAQPAASAATAGTAGDDAGKAAGRLGCIDAKLMSWHDDWHQHGVGDKCVDVAYSSRSGLIDDIGIVLGKLTAAARRCAALTLCVGSTPHEDAVLMRAIGRRPRGEFDLQIAFNMLIEQGFQPTVRYIVADKHLGYPTVEEAVERCLARVPNLTTAERQKADQFVREHLIDSGDPADPARFVPSYRTISDWAFIWWPTDISA